MACKSIGDCLIQREEPPVSGGSWATTDCGLQRGESLTTRAQFTNTGAGTDCTGTINFQYRPTVGTTWSTYNNVPTANPNTWYEAEFDQPGNWRLRSQLVYDGSTYTSPITFIVRINPCAEGQATPTTVTEGQGTATSVIEGQATATTVTEGQAVTTTVTEGQATGTTVTEGT